MQYLSHCKEAVIQITKGNAEQIFNTIRILGVKRKRIKMAWS